MKKEVHIILVTILFVPCFSSKLKISAEQSEDFSLNLLPKDYDKRTFPPFEVEGKISLEHF